MNSRVQEVEQAYSAARYARQASRARDTCPMYGITRDAEELRESWRNGWDDEDREQKHANDRGK